ncbi:UDP-N-acetylglucosamine 1-carboxyvinyltransferase [candidate division WOR-3 bacterium]|nr:UDP-N-acetylglucosamine 1-carboxyvinyltransferase [candidate division WOR-3 bacterium]
MDSFEITGPSKIEGFFKPKGNKNAALPMIAAACLTEEEVTLKNVPVIRDVQYMIDLLRLAGAECEWEGDGVLRLNSRRITNFDLDPEICSKIRASILLAGPFLARNGYVRFPPPGGDVIGRRRLDTHFVSLGSMGAKIEWDGSAYVLKAEKKLMGREIFLDEPSVTGTENALMAASLASGTTLIKNAACEPHVQDLCGMLVKMGSSISGISTNRLEITGEGSLHGAEAEISPDYIETGSVVALAALTGGRIEIDSLQKDHVEPVLISFRKLGIETEFKDGILTVPENQELAVKTDFGDAIPTVSDGPWPGFPADLTSIALVTATGSRGTVLVFEKMFESRMFFVDKLVSMGAKIVLCDPHRAVITGPSKLRAQYMSSPDIRAGMALLIAASIAEGKSVISNAHQIDRGYENIDRRLSDLGLKIKRV